LLGASSSTTLLDERPARLSFREKVLRGLSQTPKRLPGRYAFDRRGSMLVEATCAQPECYFPHAEQQIMQRHGMEMAAEVGSDAMLIAFHNVSGIKKWPWVKHLPPPATYVPIELSPEHLLSTIDCLSRVFELPSHCPDHVRRVVHLPEAAIGALEPTEAVQLLGRFARLCGPRGGLLVAIDLIKDPAVIERSYNDRAGVSAEFNLNLLLRINRELGGEFDLDEFQHLASYDTRQARVDVRLMSKVDRQVHVDGRLFRFNAGEAIHARYAHKYTVDRFAQLAGEAGFSLRRVWADDRQYAAVLSLAN
jgi:dimethylhistidine N-methyltransferase